MDSFFFSTVLEVIDMRSFSNLWFWIALAVLWSTASYWVVGVPFDTIRRADRGDMEALQDLMVLGGIQSRRLIHISEVSGLLMTGFTYFVVTSLALIGFLYDMEFAQAVFLLFLPMTIVGWLNLRTARTFVQTPSERITGILLRHRRIVQLMGVIAIFVTTMWGMYSNLNTNVLGG